MAEYKGKTVTLNKPRAISKGSPGYGEKRKEVFVKNKIEYISKIDAIKFKFEKDFLINKNFTFSDGDHWSEFGEIYFGKKLIYNSRLKEILFP